MPECSIQELAQHLVDGKAEKGRPPRFALFLGAGASTESGIAGTATLIERFRNALRERWQSEQSVSDFDDWLRNAATWVSSASDYANLFERYEPSRRGRALYIEKLVADGDPGNGYLCLSQLLAQGYFDVVVTTNFDDLVYEACARWTSVRPRVYSVGEPAGPIRHQLGRASILKLHGDYLHSHLAKNTNAEVGQPDPNMETQVKDAKLEYDLIVIGYSGNDESIMRILETSDDGLTGVYWCTYKDEPLGEKAERLLTERQNWHRVRTNGFESVMGYWLHRVGFLFPDVERTYWEQKADTITTIMKSSSPYRQDFLGTAVAATKAEAGPATDDQREWVQAFLAGFAAYHKGDSGSAVASLRRAHEIRPTDGFTRAFLGLALTRSNEVEEAISILGSAQHDGDVLSAWGLAWTKTGQESQAITVLQLALKRFPESIEVLISLSAALMKNGRVPEAIMLLRQAHGTNPDNVQIVIALSSALTKDGRQAEGIDLIRPVWERGKDNPDVVSTLGFALWQDGQVDETIALLREALKLFPISPNVLSSLGAALARIDRVEEGIEILSEAQRLYPHNADVLSALGFALMQGGRASEAIAPLREAAECHPDDLEVVLTDLGLAFYGEGRREEAEQVFQRILGMTSGHASNDLGRLCWRGVALLAVGLLDDARSLFGTLIDRRPQPLAYLRDVLISLRRCQRLGLAGVEEFLSMVDDAVRQ